MKKSKICAEACLFEYTNIDNVSSYLHYLTDWISKYGPNTYNCLHT